MNLFRIVGDIEPVGPYQIVLMLHQIPHSVVQLPGDLDTSRPVVGIGDRRIPAFWKTSSFGIKNQIHPDGFMVVTRSL